jgi:hypothetical protein
MGQLPARFSRTIGRARGNGISLPESVPLSALSLNIRLKDEILNQKNRSAEKKRTNRDAWVAEKKGLRAGAADPSDQRRIICQRQ